MTQMSKSHLFDWAPELPCCCDLSFENAALAQGYYRVAGVDEVGRGALFGPVCAAAVILDLNRIPVGINDSKKLSVKHRQQLAENIREAALDFSVAFVEAEAIDKINILEATKEAMRLAIRRLGQPPDFLLCDGLLIDGIAIPQRGIVKGDARSVSIGAASILAKVERDQLLSELAVRYPGYSLAQNKGYGTRAHLEALKQLGPTSQHRLTFRGVLQEKAQPSENDQGRLSGF
jgi:ribonuclease HII